MDLPPPNARPTGVLFDDRGTPKGSGADAPGLRAAPSCPDEARLFGFESELEANLTYLPMAMRFKLDKCGIKLALAEWQQLPEQRRREPLRAPCDDAASISSYRRVLRSVIKESTGSEPSTIATPEHPPWAENTIPEQVTTAAAATGLAMTSPGRWDTLTALEKFALIKLSRDGRDHRNLVPALRELGFL